MSQQELLAYVLRVLDSQGIEYMLTGSIASSFYGEPRATHDIDIVVNIQKSQVGSLVAAFPQPDYYLAKESIIEAIDSSDMFNLIDVKTGGKVDFWILTDDPFDQSRFTRKLKEKVLGQEVWISSPEDTILMKLKWAKLAGNSEKQMLDAIRIYEIQFPILEMSYIERWAKQLNILTLWQKLKETAII